MGSASDKISGKAKKMTGKITGNKRMESKGRIEEGKGGLKDQIRSRIP